jgi:hypothetical protein
MKTQCCNAPILTIIWIPLGLHPAVFLSLVGKQDNRPLDISNED